MSTRTKLGNLETELKGEEPKEEESKAQVR